LIITTFQEVGIGSPHYKMFAKEFILSGLVKKAKEASACM